MQIVWSIWVYTVYKGLSVPIHRAIMVHIFFYFSMKTYAVDAHYFLAEKQKELL